MGVDLSGWLLGGLSQKHIPSLLQQCNTLNLPGSSPMLPCSHFKNILRITGLCPGRFHCGRGDSCFGDITALLQKVLWKCLDSANSKLHVFFQVLQLGQVLINPISFLHMFDKWEDVLEKRFIKASWEPAAEPKCLTKELSLHHLGCKKPCKWWDKLPTSTGARRVSSNSMGVIWAFNS